MLITVMLNVIMLSVVVPNFAFLLGFEKHLRTILYFRVRLQTQKTQNRQAAHWHCPACLVLVE
jgi:hypothetical protein